MTEKNIKPIPKKILKEIEKLDKSKTHQKPGETRFYSYFTKSNKELLLVTVAVRQFRNKRFCKQVVVHGINSTKCYLKDIMFNNMAGFKVGWFAEGITKYPRWYEYSDWGWNDDKYFNIQCPIINIEYALNFDEFKYSAIDIAKPTKPLEYLRLYKKYPQVELLTKFGLSKLSTSKLILNKIDKDKNFRKWLINHREEIQNSYFYINAIISAYKTNKPLKYIQQKIELTDSLKKDLDRYQEIIALFESINNFIEYLIKQNMGLASYADYFNACRYLNINMTEEKNYMPHNLRYWHDIRIDQYRTNIALENIEKNKELIKKFKNVSHKYSSLQRKLKGVYITLIAQTPADLVFEGKELMHCVGRMNYDQKFAREESLIFFIRHKEQPDVPFVTVEYSIKNKSVLQCYGYKDTKPEQMVLDYVNKVWLPYANKKLEKLTA